VRSRKDVVAAAKEFCMAFEAKKTRLSLLLARMLNEPHDRKELYEQIRQKLNEIEACGMPLPADLVQFEENLDAQFAAEKEDQRRRARLDKVVVERARRRSA
jgi:hypothetical protein